MAKRMRRRRFAAVVGGVAAVVAVSALVMLLAAGSLSGQPSGQPIYEAGPLHPVGFFQRAHSTEATVQLKKVKPFAPEEVPPELIQRFPRMEESGAQVWVYEVKSVRAPAINFWHLGLCPDIKKEDILQETEQIDGPDTHRLRLPDHQVPAPVHGHGPRPAPSSSRSWAAGPSFAYRHW